VAHKTPIRESRGLLYVSTQQRAKMLFEIIEANCDFYFTDAHEIGTSDVSICVNSIIKEYAPFTEDFASTPTRQVIRRMVNNYLSSLEDLHECQVRENVMARALNVREYATR